MQSFTVILTSLEFGQRIGVFNRVIEAVEFPLGLGRLVLVSPSLCWFLVVVGLCLFLCYEYECSLLNYLYY